MPNILAQREHIADAGAHIGPENCPMAYAGSELVGL